VPVALGTRRGWSGSSVHVDAKLGERPDDLSVRLHLTALFWVIGRIFVRPRANSWVTPRVRQALPQTYRALLWPGDHLCGILPTRVEEIAEIGRDHVDRRRTVCGE
jgi:hypothetical protein